MVYAHIISQLAGALGTWSQLQPPLTEVTEALAASKEFREHHFNDADYLGGRRILSGGTCKQ